MIYYDLDYDMEKEYSDVSAKYLRLNDIVKDLISHKLQAHNVRFSSIKSRVKNFDSFFEKYHRKGYENPFEQCTDILGLRVVAYLDSDIEVIERIIKEIFSVDTKQSIDKRVPESVREFGYRSLHLICRLGDVRKDLPEYSSLYDLCFEVQIRTALQDTWAEIEHTFNYKSQASLPHELERKLFSASAILESVDSILSQVTSEAVDYFQQVSTGGVREPTDPLTKIGMLALVEKYAKIFGVKNLVKEFEKIPSNDNAQKELQQFGISTLAELEKLMKSAGTNNYVKYSNSRKVIAPIQFVRIAMILSDPKKYFSKVDTSTLTGVRPEMVDWIQTEFPDLNIAEILDENDIPVNNE